MVVLDSWALLAYLKDEPSAERIEAEWLVGVPAISSINLGEALYMRVRERGEEAAAKEIATIRKRSTIIDPDWGLVSAAARIKAGGGLSYADAFCVVTAQRLGVPLWTGDPEIIHRADDLSCEVVDLRAADRRS
ncbi:MAG TPA: type II toxin-antitoxin system VapC family toxin [Solirubrobacterales bacterium]|nr:type II toxin-antitoxin system VapC family toxin [Solirubrobacterales bacterium]